MNRWNLLSAALIGVFFTTASLASTDSFSIASAHCDLKKIKSLAGDGLLYIRQMHTPTIMHQSNQDAAHPKPTKFKIYHVKVNTKVLTSTGLFQTMKKAGCFHY